ncbi:MAG: prenyltransferase/squalene oxidase repeat-containing protein [Verrucomicrobiota bacterium]
MSLRLEMLQVARLSPNLLSNSTASIVDFVHAQQNQDGGFSDLNGKSDVYYTMFALLCLQALHQDLPVDSVTPYLDTFSELDTLDFVHLSCLARCYDCLASHDEDRSQRMMGEIEQYRSRDGGYHPDQKHAEQGTIYGCFLAVGSYQDLGGEFPEPAAMARCLASLRTEDGAYANEAALPVGTTPATTAAVTLLRYLDHPVDQQVGKWILQQCHQDGGFFAMPFAPIPDLLTTATALHALETLEVSFEHLKEPCLNFIDSLWSTKGAFYGNWEEETLDCEYTFYGLLALGYLSL